MEFKTLEDVLSICSHDQELAITVCHNGKVVDMTTRTVDTCPKHLYGFEVTEMGMRCGYVILTIDDRVDTLTWNEVYKHIQSMPEWARTMPAQAWLVVDGENLEAHRVRKMMTSYAKKPEDVQDDGTDCVFMEIV